MCDSLVAVGTATADGSVILAKNSDREPNEAQALTYVPRARHEPGATVECTYIAVPQVGETYEALLSRPFWMWGCEMGVNEHGLAIANEAVFTREPYREIGLTGMDLMRLALERTASARRALELVIELIETYGQGGNGGLRHKLMYHNSFIFADPREAWVLETADKFWAAERVRDVRSISNRLTIGNEWDLASDGLIEHAVEKGWCRSRDDFDFARCYSDFLYTRMDGSESRYCRSSELLAAQRGRLDVAAMMTYLRDHGAAAAADSTWNPGKGVTMHAICAHATLGPLRPSQSTAAMVAHLTPELATAWLTGTSAPCTGIFKPVYLGGAGLPDLGPEPAGVYDPDSLWWRHERLHRAVIRDYPTRMALYRAERDELEAAFRQEAQQTSAQYAHADPIERAAPLAALTASCFERAAQATARWSATVAAAPLRQRPGLPFRLAWDRFLAREAGFPSE